MNNNETIWKPVPGYEGLYEVSDDGQVKSLASKGKILRPRTDRYGYLAVYLYKERKRTYFTVHRLVLLAFVGPAPEGTEACHWNDLKDDNRIENLRWGSKRENMLDRVRNGRHRNANKTHCPRGHSLSIPGNLKPSDLKIGRRTCLACHRAQNRNRKLGLDKNSPEFRALSDECYAELLCSLEEPVLTAKR